MSRRASSLLARFAAGTAVSIMALPIAQAAGQAATGVVQSISPQDKQEGAKANPQLVEEFGGAVTGPQAAYVESVGKNIAVQSGLSNAKGDFTVTLLNSSVDNAFAIPGGYIYTTRQLVTLMNNEAELAGVLGHEVGHVAARHSAKRQSEATRNTVIGVLGTLLTGVLLGNSGIGQVLQQGFMQGSQLLTLRYSRSQETEADNFGIQYLRSAGYDPRAMSTVLQSLANQTNLEARLMGTADRVPEWASTHPDPASRVQAALVRAGANASGRTDRDVFLTRINGLLYGDDPKQGLVEGRKFTHPEMGIQFEAPAGFYMVNGTRAVAISGQAGKGQLTAAAYNGNLDTYVRSAFAGLAQSGEAKIAPGSVTPTTVNGIKAAYGAARVMSGGNQVDVTVFAYELGAGQAVHFVTIVPAGSADVFGAMFASMHRITAAQAAAVKPRRLQVVTVRKGDTVQSLASRMAYADAPLDRFLVLNGLSQTSKLAVGQRVKLVTY